MLCISCSRKVGLVPRMVRIMVLLSKKKNGLMMIVIVIVKMEMILLCQRNLWLWFVMRILVLSIMLDFSSP